MNTVLLHPLGFQINLLHKKGHQRNIVLLRQFDIDIIESVVITTTVVRRQADLHQQRLRISRLNRGNDFT